MYGELDSLKKEDNQNVEVENSVEAVQTQNIYTTLEDVKPVEEVREEEAVAPKDDMYDEFGSLKRESHSAEEYAAGARFSILEAYGENLSKKTYITNPAIAREKEIKETIMILLTPDKSALLVGKPGIGKTAIIEGIGYMMQRGEVPNALKGYDIIKVNVPALLGNAVSEGQSENRLQLLIEELKHKENIILFIDEVHLLIGKNANSSLDFANMLKPGLDRGTIKMIGATTTEEYEQYVLRDRAFNRRFLRVDVEEPTPETVVKILMGTHPRLEKQTKVTCNYTDYIKERIFLFLANMTSEYKRVYEVGNRYPDITITLLASAYSSASYDNSDTLQLKHIINAIVNCKNVYDDAKRKDLALFKEEFKDILWEEGISPEEFDRMVKPVYNN